MHLRLQAGGHQSMTFSKDSAHTGVALLHATLLRLCSHGHADWMHGCSTWKRLFWRRNMLCCQRPCTPATPAIVQVPGYVEQPARFLFLACPFCSLQQTHAHKPCNTWRSVCLSYAVRPRTNV
eukprot:352149-Chlamydomonas_euryale.AAC.7